MARNTQSVQQWDELTTIKKIYTFKLVLLGKTGVGKSALAERFVREQFHSHIQSTVGAAFFNQSVYIDDSAVTFQIWDTAGQEKYSSILPMYYRGAHAAVVVYDVLDQGSFASVKTWVENLRQRAAPNVVIALAGNKVDLAVNRTVDFEEAKQYAKENGLIFMETSAKTAVNVNEIFLAIARKLPKDETHGSKRDTIQPSKRESVRKSSNCCITNHKNYGRIK